MTTPNQVNAVRQILDAVLETIKAAGVMGAPGGHLYAALMSQGCTLQQFESLMGILLQSGRVTKRGDCYYA